MEKELGMHSSTLSEMFWEAIMKLYGGKSHIRTQFQNDLFEERAKMYGKCVQERGGL